MVKLKRVNSWTPRIGDPTLIAWTCAGMHALAAISCGFAAMHIAKPQRQFWAGLALCSALLAGNKQLDVHSAVLTLVNSLRAGEVFEGPCAGIVVVAAFTISAIVGMFLIIYGVRSSSKPMIISLGAFAFLAVLLVGRNTIPMLSPILGFHLTSEEETLFHVHVSEVVELVFAAAIVYCALRGAGCRHLRRRGCDTGLGRQRDMQPPDQF